MLTIVICLVVIGVACVAVLRITLEDENQPATAPRQRHRASPETDEGRPTVVDLTDPAAAPGPSATRPKGPDAGGGAPTIPAGDGDGGRPSTTRTMFAPDVDTTELRPVPTTPLLGASSAPLRTDDAVTTAIPDLVEPVAAIPGRALDPVASFGATALPDVEEPMAAATGWPDDLDDVDDTEPVELPTQTPTSEPAPEPVELPTQTPTPEPVPATEPPLTVDVAPLRIREHPTARRQERPATVHAAAPDIAPSTGVFDHRDGIAVVLTPIDNRRRLRSTAALALLLTLIGCLVALALVAVLGLLIFGVRSALGS